MGNWKLSVVGSGPHHNGQDTDIDTVARELVVALKLIGHKVTDATLEVVGTVEPVNLAMTVTQAGSPPPRDIYQCRYGSSHW